MDESQSASRSSDVVVRHELQVVLDAEQAGREAHAHAERAVVCAAEAGWGGEALGCVVMDGLDAAEELRRHGGERSAP